jgi:hypothetical protein
MAILALPKHPIKPRPRLYKIGQRQGSGTMMHLLNRSLQWTLAEYPKYSYKNMEDLGTTLKAKWLACLLKHDLFGSSSMLSILRHVVV